jgi:hypothetical protein
MTAKSNIGRSTVAGLVECAPKLLLALALISVLLGAASASARAAVGGDGEPPILQPQPGLEYPWTASPALTLESHALPNGDLRFAVRGSQFTSGGNVTLQAIGAKSGQPAAIFPGGTAATGASFAKLTNLRPCKFNGTVTGTYLVTATDQATGKVSNTLTITSCA